MIKLLLIDHVSILRLEVKEILIVFFTLPCAICIIAVAQNHGKTSLSNGVKKSTSISQKNLCGASVRPLNFC